MSVTLAEDAFQFAVAIVGLIAIAATCVLPVLFLTLRIRDIVRRARDQAHGVQRCAKCGYDLRSSGNRCPECGAWDAERNERVRMKPASED